MQGNLPYVVVPAKLSDQEIAEKQKFKKVLTLEEEYRLSQIMSSWGKLSAYFQVNTVTELELEKMITLELTTKRREDILNRLAGKLGVLVSARIKRTVMEALNERTNH